MESTPLTTCLPSAAGAAVSELAARRRRSSIYGGAATPSRTPLRQLAFLAPVPWHGIVEGLSIVWSFAQSDIKTMVLPVTLFGVCSALAGEQLFQHPIPVAHILARTPLVVLWTWLNVLLLAISNQRSPESITEDRANKPWRPIAAGRISAEQARRLLLVVAPIVMLTGVGLHVSQETFWAIAGSWYYSDLGGADDNLFLRQFLNGLAYIAYGIPVCRILAGPQIAFNATFWIWLTLIAIIVATTIQVQDLKDEAGGRLRNRQTAPIVLGNWLARLSVAVGILFWTVATLWWWEMEVRDMIGPMILGGLIAYRAMHIQSQSADKRTILLWGLWLIALAALPALKNGSGLRTAV